MGKRFILTAIGVDRPGIVADVTAAIYEHGCNLEDSAMTSLLDEFALVLLFSGKGENVGEQLGRACRRLEREKGITAFVRPVQDREKEKDTGAYEKLIRVEGVDQAGIVYKISRYLAGRDINISNLTSRRIQSPETGTAIYSMEIAVQVPAGIPVEELEEGISRVGEELTLDIVIRDIVDLS